MRLKSIQAFTFSLIFYGLFNDAFSKYTVTYRPIARQRLGKHIPAGANAQQISKQVSLTVEAVFSAWSVQSGYKEVFGSIE
jgi:hypothetical protein